MKHNISIFCQTFAKLAKVNAEDFEDHCLYPKGQSEFVVNSQVFTISRDDDGRTTVTTTGENYILVGKLYPATEKNPEETSGCDFIIGVESY